MLEKWMIASPHEVLLVLLSAVCVYAIIIFYTRLAGLRSFSKMAAPDFAMTVAVGSLLGSSIISASPPVLLAAVALGGLFLGQWLLAFARTRISGVSKLVDNRPVLLMSGKTVLHDNMQRTQVTMDDLHAKLREANVWSYEQVIAVIFETTGDVSVVHKSLDTNPPIKPEIFTNVIDHEQLSQA